MWVVQSGQAMVQPVGGAAKTSPSFQIEKTTLVNLTPNTRYDYEVAGVKGYFKTPPGPPVSAGNFRFVAYGDNRTRPDVHRKVIEAMLKNGIPDFVVQSGDMVEDGSSSILWADFFDIEHDLLRQTAFFPALGNHEHNLHLISTSSSISRSRITRSTGAPLTSPLSIATSPATQRTKANATPSGPKKQNGSKRIWRRTRPPLTGLWLRTIRR